MKLPGLALSGYKPYMRVCSTMENLEGACRGYIVSSSFFLCVCLLFHLIISSLFNGLGDG